MRNKELDVEEEGGEPNVLQMDLMTDKGSEDTSGRVRRQRRSLLEEYGIQNRLISRTRHCQSISHPCIRLSPANQRVLRIFIINIKYVGGESLHQKRGKRNTIRKEEEKDEVTVPCVRETYIKLPDVNSKEVPGRSRPKTENLGSVPDFYQKNSPNRGGRRGKWTWGNHRQMVLVRSAVGEV